MPLSFAPNRPAQPALRSRTDSRRSTLVRLQASEARSASTARQTEPSGRPDGAAENRAQDDVAKVARMYGVGRDLTGLL